LTCCARSASNPDYIDRSIFLQSVGAKSAFADRMFTIFDTDHNEKVTFTEYIHGLSILGSRGTLDEKVRFCFAIYDLDGDGKISKKVRGSGVRALTSRAVAQDLGEMLRLTMEENDVKMTPKQINSIIDSTFAEADRNADGLVDLAEFRIMTDNHRSILSNMTLDFKVMIEQRQKELASGSQ